MIQPLFQLGERISQANGNNEVYRSLDDSLQVIRIPTPQLLSELGIVGVKNQYLTCMAISSYFSQFDFAHARTLDVGSVLTPNDVNYGGLSHLPAMSMEYVPGRVVKYMDAARMDQSQEKALFEEAGTFLKEHGITLDDIQGVYDEQTKNFKLIDYDTAVIPNMPRVWVD